MMICSIVQIWLGKTGCWFKQKSRRFQGCVFESRCLLNRWNLFFKKNCAFEDYFSRKDVSFFSDVFSLHWFMDFEIKVCDKFVETALYVFEHQFEETRFPEKSFFNHYCPSKWRKLKFWRRISGFLAKAILSVFPKPFSTCPEENFKRSFFQEKNNFLYLFSDFE